MAISPKTDLPWLGRFDASKDIQLQIFGGEKTNHRSLKSIPGIRQKWFHLPYILVSGIDGAGEQPVGRKCMAHYAHSFSPIAFVRSVEKHMRNKGLTMANACLPVPGSAEDISNLQSRDSFLAKSCCRCFNLPWRQMLPCEVLDC